MADTNSNSHQNLRRLAFKITKATIKGAIFYGIYFFLSGFLTPISELLPGFMQTIETFVIIYIVLMVIGELTSGTIHQHFFNAAKALFVISYMLLSLRGGVFGVTFENVSLMVDLRLFLMIATLLGLVGLAKTVLQAINYMNEKACPTNT